MTPLPDHLSLWTAKTRTLGFYALFVASVVTLVAMLYPFTFSLLFAAVTAVVAYPLQARLTHSLGERSHVAAVLVMTVVVLAVVVPILLGGFVFGRELRDLVETAQRVLVDSDFNLPFEVGDPEVMLAQFFGEQGADQGMVVDQFTGTILPGAGAVTSFVTRASLNIAVYLAASYAFLADGPAALRVLLRVFPLDPYHGARLFTVFREIARNFVVGTAATAVLQGLVSGVGWWLLALPHGLMFACAIALASLVPVIGTLAVWGPAAAAVAFTVDPWTAGMLVLWNLLLTGTVDNLVKPLFLRGRSNLNTVAVFLSVFGGIVWFGLPGLLVGPMVYAICAALYRIHCEEYLGLVDPAPSQRRRLREMLNRAFVRRPPDSDEPAGAA